MAEPIFDPEVAKAVADVFREAARPSWFACQEERPSNIHTIWHVGCAGCRIKAQAEWRQAQADPDGERASFFFYFGGPPWELLTDG